MDSEKFSGLTGNQLKLIALITMTIDHLGMMLFPRIKLLRIIGRIAFPIFAYMIAEGCQYTRNRKKYLFSMASLAAVCQLVYFFATGSLYMSVLVTFSLSIGLIYLLDRYDPQQRGSQLSFFLGLSGVFFLCYMAHDVLFPKTDFGIEYGLWGVLLPVFTYWGAKRQKKLQYFTVGLALLGLTWGGIQLFCLAAIPLIALYNGKRGKRKMKNLFYIYYPAHLVVIHFLSLL